MNLYNKYYQGFHRDFILYVPLTIIFQSCLGSIAAMFILKNSTGEVFHGFELALCVCLCMAYNGAIYACLKSRIVFNLLILSVLTSVVLIALNMARI